MCVCKYDFESMILNLPFSSAETHNKTAEIIKVKRNNTRKLMVFPCVLR